jgi:hypothetical protein
VKSSDVRFSIDKEQKMGRRKRRDQSPTLIAKLALAAPKGERALREVAEQFGVHPNQIQDWEKRLVEGVEGAA